MPVAINEQTIGLRANHRFIERGSWKTGLSAEMTGEARRS